MKRLFISAVGFFFFLPGSEAWSKPKPQPKAPKVDVTAVINDSYQFLRNREPVMTGVEYSLYETIIPMVFEQPDYAIRLLETMISDEEPESPAFEFVLGNMYFMQDRLVSAEARYMSAVKRYPEFLRAWFNLGVMRFTMARYAEAIPCFTKVIALGDREAETLGLLAYCLQRTGNGLVAEMAYMQALTAEPDNIELVEGLLKLYLQNGNRVRAEALLRQGLRLDPGDGEKYLLYAKSLQEDGRLMQAIVVLEMADSFDLLDEEGLLYLGNLQVQNKLFPEAVASYRKVIDLNPDLGVDRLLTYARMLVGDGRLDEAEAILSGLEEQLDQRTRIPFLRAASEIAFARSDWVQARRRLEEMLSVAPLDGEGLVRLGQVHQMEGDLARAELVLERAYRLEDSRYRASLELANLAVRNRRIDRSITYLEQAIRLEESAELREHLERMKALVSFRGSPGIEGTSEKVTR